MRAHVDERIAERATNQLGLFTVDQAREAGASAWLRNERVRTGIWERRSARVLALRGVPMSWKQRLLAGQLDAGGVAAITGVTAAAVLGVPTFSAHAGLPHVLVKRGGNHRPILCQLHETFWFPPEHVQRCGPLTIVSWSRLPFELAIARLPRPRVEWMIDHAMNERGLTYDELALAGSVLCRRGRPASPMIRALVEERVPGYVPPASALEAFYRDMCNEFGLPEGIRQQNIGGDAWIGRVDVAYPEHKLLVELDSRRWHGARTAFESDRERTNELVRAGWRVIRITWRMLHDEPEKVAALVRSMLASAA